MGAHRSVLIIAHVALMRRGERIANATRPTASRLAPIGIAQIEIGALPDVT